MKDDARRVKVRAGIFRFRFMNVKLVMDFGDGFHIHRGGGGRWRRAGGVRYTVYHDNPWHKSQRPRPAAAQSGHVLCPSVPDNAKPLGSVRPPWLYMCGPSYAAPRTHSPVTRPCSIRARRGGAIGFPDPITGFRSL